MEEALAKSEERYRTMIEFSNDFIWTLDTRGRFTFFNRRAEEASGRKCEEWRGRSFTPLIHPDDLSNVAEVFRKTLCGEPQTYKVRIFDAGGNLIVLSVNTAPIRENGSITGTVSFGRDITASWLAEEELRKHRERLEEMVKERTADLESFAHSVSHDLRSPLNSVIGFSDALLEYYTGSLDPQGRDAIRCILEAGRTMQHVISGLNRLHRVTRENLRIERVDLSAMAEKINAMQRTRDQGRDVEVVIAGGLAVRGDAELLYIALENLLGNAWKFTKNAGRGEIELGVDDTGSEPVYFIRDNGAGFDAAAERDLFTPFHRCHSDAEFAGSGIGLATTKRVMSRHGGRIWAKSSKGRGATFFFTLPAAQPA